MSLIVVDQGEHDFLDAITGVGYTLHLFQNDVIDSLTEGQIEALDESDFTESDFAGYSAATLTGGSWTTTAADPSTATYAVQTFTRSSTGTPQDVYGYYVTRTSDGRLQWFEYLDAEFDPVVIENAGEAIQVTPRITLRDDSNDAP